jgi:hypothetical protein
MQAPVEIWQASQAGHNEIRQSGGLEAAAAFLERRVTR